MNVVIVAGGIQSRFKDLSCFPKILLPSSDGRPILMRQLEYFNDSTSVSIIVNERFADIMIEYVKTNNLPIKVIISGNINGSGNTLSSVKAKLPEHNVLFFWSDILFEDNKFSLDSKIDMSKDDCVVFTTNEKKYRYNIENDKIVNKSSSYDGNVPGIFWIKNTNEVIPSTISKDNVDLIDIIKDKVNNGLITFTESKINTNIVEYKSLDDYKEIMSSCHREDITISTDINIIHDEKEHMIGIAKNKDDFKYQYDWETMMRYMPNMKQYCLSTPISIYDNGDCDMSELEGYCYATNAVNTDIIDIVKKMGKSKINVKLSDSFRFLLNEYNYNTLYSYLKVCGLLESPLSFIEFQSIVDKACGILIDNTNNTEWVFSHGNLNSHNVLKNVFGNIKFINPIMRCNNGMSSVYLPSIVDISEAYIMKFGLDEALRKTMIYKVDKLPNIDYDLDIHIKCAIYLHLLSMMTEFAYDIMKVNIIFSYCVDGLKRCIDND